MLVTRAEEWCVDAASPEEAKALLEKGEGHRCAPGEIFCVELGDLCPTCWVNAKAGCRAREK